MGWEQRSEDAPALHSVTANMPFAPYFFKQEDNILRILRCGCRQHERESHPPAPSALALCGTAAAGAGALPKAAPGAHP